MGWSKVVTALVLFPVFALSPGSEVDLVNKACHGQTFAERSDGVNTFYVRYQFQKPVTQFIVHAICPGGYSTDTVTSTVSPTPETVTVTSTVSPTPKTVTVTSTVSPVDTTPTSHEGSSTVEGKHESNICEPKYGVWGVGYFVSTYFNLHLCDRIPINTRPLSHIACSGLSSGAMGVSIGSVCNIISSCKDVRSFDILPVQSTSFVGLGTAILFKTYGCTKFFSNRVESFEKCNGWTDHAITVFSSMGSTIVNS